MPCKKIINKFNDLLDRTLSSGEECEVQDHLAACPHCRGEFQLVKNADDMLRTTVLEMVAEIEVPSYLTQKIGQVLAGEKKRQFSKLRLFGLLQAPAFAAAMLILVVASGIFGYYKLFDPSLKNPAVVLSVPQNQLSSESAGGAEAVPFSVTGQDQLTVKDVTTTEAPYRAVSPLTPDPPPTTDGMVIMQDADILKAEAIARQNAPPGRGGGDSLNPKEKSVDGQAQALGTEERSIPMLSSQSSGTAKLSISSIAAPRQGTLQEATREVGFTPVVPGYLPPEAELKDVTWVPGTVYLDYRVDRYSFKFTQSRTGEAGVNVEEGGQLIDINGAKANMQETSPTSAQKWGYTNLCWQRGELVFTVGGDLPREEILKIALSIK